MPDGGIIMPVGIPQPSEVLHATSSEQHDQDKHGIQDTYQTLDIEDPSSPKRTKIQTTAIVIALFLSTFAGALDTTILATAIPTIASEFEAASSYSWIGSTYLIANAASGTIWTKFSDIWGRKPITLAGIAVFLFSSLICALAKNISMLLAGRVLQGIGGSCLLTLPIVVMSDIFSMRTRSLLIGMTEVMWAMAGGLGPVLGGVLTERVDWRWIFWINLPISGIAFILILLCLDVHNPRTPMLAGLKAVDWAGSLSITGLTVMLLMGLNFGGEQYPWGSPTVICLIVFGVAMSALFVFSEKKVARYPLMPMTVFKNTSVVGCTIVTITQGLAFVAATYYLPLYLQATHLSSPFHSGLQTMGLETTMSLTALFVGILTHRTDAYRLPMILGMAIMTIGLGIFNLLDADTPIIRIIGFEVLVGVGIGAIFQPPIIAAQVMVPQDEAAAVTATIGFVRNLGSALAIVIYGVVIQNSMSNKMPQLQAAGLPLELVKKFAGAEAIASVQAIPLIEDTTQKDAVRNAFAESMQNMWILATVFAGLGFFSSFMVKQVKLSDDHTETITGLKDQEKKSPAENVTTRQM